MIDFKEGYIPEKRQTTLTAYVSESDLLALGKNYARHIVQELVKQSVIVHRIELENIVTEFICSQETRKYIEDKVREAIDKYIVDEVAEIFNRDKI